MLENNEMDFAEFIRLKSEPEYYADSRCKYGYIRGSETIHYVYEVLERYDCYKAEIVPPKYAKGGE
jgi:membrane-bound lytic murein transglycosylase F